MQVVLSPASRGRGRRPIPTNPYRESLRQRIQPLAHARGACVCKAPSHPCRGGRTLTGSAPLLAQHGIDLLDCGGRVYGTQLICPTRKDALVLRRGMNPRPTSSQRRAGACPPPQPPVPPPEWLCESASRAAASLARKRSDTVVRNRRSSPVSGSTRPAWRPREAQGATGTSRWPGPHRAVQPDEPGRPVSHRCSPTPAASHSQAGTGGLTTPSPQPSPPPGGSFITSPAGRALQSGGRSQAVK